MFRKKIRGRAIVSKGYVSKNPVIFFIKQDMLKVAMLRLHAIDIWLNKQHLEHS